MILIGKDIIVYPLSLEELQNPALIEVDMSDFEWHESLKKAIKMKVDMMIGLDEALHPLYTYWIMVQKDSEKAIGMIGFKGIHQGIMEVGYGISSQFSGKGYTSQALKLVIDWAFENTFCYKIKAKVNSENIGSIRVLEKNEFKLMGQEDYLHYERENEKFIFKNHLADQAKRDRPGVYLILRKDDAYGFVHVYDTHFFIGGGVEDYDEDYMACLKRECLEEIGYSIKNISYLTTMRQYEINPEKNHYLNLIGHVFLGEMDEYIQEPVEEDHTLVWIPKDQASEALWVDYQAYVIEKMNRGDLYGVS